MTSPAFPLPRISPASSMKVILEGYVLAVQDDGDRMHTVYVGGVKEDKRPRCWRSTQCFVRPASLSSRGGASSWIEYLWTRSQVLCKGHYVMEDSFVPIMLSTMARDPAGNHGLQRDELKECW